VAIEFGKRLLKSSNSVATLPNGRVSARDNKKMSLLFKKPGILTTIQDLGRSGWQSYGINPNGVMDATAARLANILLGNNENEAVLEMHFPAGEFEFETDCSFAIAGADLGASLSGNEINNWSSAIAEKGDLLKFTERRTGTRAYLAVAGGFEINEWLGSVSTNLVAGIGGLAGRQIKAGDRIGLRDPRVVKPRRIGPSMIPRYSRFPTVCVTAGAEFDLLTAVSERTFMSEGFMLTLDSNRMGFRISGGPLFLLSNKEMVSAAVTFGTIQLLPDGQLVVLMADHQTSGGYPRIANVIAADLPLLAQLSPGDGVGFHIISIDEAESIAARFEEDLCTLRLGVRFAS